MRRVLGAGVLALAGLTATGCSLLGSDDGPSAAQVPKAEIGTDSHVKGAIAKAVQPYAGKDVYVDILSLKRYDKVLRLVYAVTPRARGNSDKLPKQTFGGSWSGGDAGRPYLLDTKNLRVYEHLSIGSGDKASCACSVGIEEYPLDQPTVLYSDYPSPDESVKELTVVMPVVGPMPGVKVS
ncbi:hypothetical protein SAMN04489712_102466 [Thermomonospora echinospora]|uniref:Lipoprotein n=1 Tax=Thermomonospora echinospora TaxID=1992 RepID=A0A1H5VUD0_9ACTN|nr:hypothetical protein [Thermomonospora echinospora]SEF90919.1 hypothetical protein SAMN04489712_102466 [Thermomonospora echinospora]